MYVSGIPEDVGKATWTGLVSQAGITLGFASVVAREFPGWGNQLQLLLVASIAIHELVGPILFRRGLAQAGELEAPQARPLVVVSNREPYLHSQEVDGRLTVKPATGGVAVALDALMRERGGVWIAHGAGSADQLVVDAADKVMVPPENPSYALRRLWLEEPTFSAYYGGFANEGLWPLCHVVDVRPKFRSEDWAAYQDINARFAAAIHDEIGSSEAPVFIQDYHLALVAPALRTLRPDTRTALFWHIPWPYPGSPSDLPVAARARGRAAGQRPARVSGRARSPQLPDGGRGGARRRGRVRVVARAVRTAVTAPWSPCRSAWTTTGFRASPQTRCCHRSSSACASCSDCVPTSSGWASIGWTTPKGIPERLDALDALMTRRPELRGKLTFVQIGVPSRSDLESYSAIEAEISQRIADINARHRVPGGSPVVTYYTTALGAFSLVALYRLAHFCIVSSLHDGMNLVAKEFVAARDDERGVLVLSELAGAAQELDDAVIINPYDVDAFASALSRAIDMPAPEQMARMRAMRKVVAGRNVFNWASDILEGLESIWTKPLLYSVRGWGETSV